MRSVGLTQLPVPIRGLSSRASSTPPAEREPVGRGDPGVVAGTWAALQLLAGSRLGALARAVELVLVLLAAALGVLIEVAGASLVRARSTRSADAPT